jgi:sigma-B regulation protein RsbU (phosphoserine phosphatase)
VFRLGGSSLGLAVADVSGKGIGASLIMASVKAVLPLLAAGRSVEQTLQALNAKLSSELSAREFVALAYARYDPVRGEIEIANAGLPDPYLLRERGRPEPLSVPGPRLPLGLKSQVAYRSLSVPLSARDRVLFLTDGLPEAPTPNGDPLGYESLFELLPSDREEPGVSLDGLLERVRRATSHQLEDDWTVLLLEHAGGAAEETLPTPATAV